MRVMPVLSTKGWVSVTEHPLVVANQMLAHFFCSDHSQTYLYGNNVKSFSYILQSKNGDIDSTKQALRGELETYFKRYFDDCSVDIAEMPEDLTGKVSLKLYLDFTQDNITHTLSKAINLTDGTVRRIIDINNGA